MMNLNRQIPTVFIPEAIAPAGIRSAELKPLTLAIVDCETNLTVDAASYHPDKRYQIVFKTASTGMDNKMFPDQRGAKLPIRLDVGHVTKAHKFTGGSEEPKNFVAYWGWDGISDCKTISLDCGQDYGLQITVRGESIRNVFNRNLTEIVPFNTGCCEDCNLDEKCELTTANIMKAIKNSSFYVGNYFEVSPVKSCCPEEDPFERKPYKQWLLTVCDNGGPADLARVQMQYPAYDVERVSREAPYSTYEICIAEGETPEDFVQKNIKALKCDECPDCPDEFTKIEGGDKVTACIYSPLLADSTEAFTLDYYTDPTTAQDTIDGLVEGLAASIPGYVAGSAKILGTTCDDITLQACVTKDTDLKEHGVAGLTLNLIGECQGKCEGEKATAWCEGKDLYKITRTKCITLKKDDCEEGIPVDETHPLFLDIKTSVEKDDSIVVDSLAVRKDNDCLVSFTVEQCSNCVEDGCDTYGKDGAKFTRLESYEGVLWEDCDCEGWTFDAEGCPLPPESMDVSSCLCGLKFEGAYVDPETAKPCIYDIGDNVEREPIEIEVTLIRQYQDETYGDCDAEEAPDWTVVQHGKVAEGLGQFVARKEVLSREYDLYMYFNPKGHEGNLYADRLGYAYQFDANKRYNHISLFINRDMPRTYHKHDGVERHLLEIYVDAQNVTLFEDLVTLFNKTLLSHGVKNLL